MFTVSLQINGGGRLADGPPDWQAAAIFSPIELILKIEISSYPAQLPTLRKPVTNNLAICMGVGLTANGVPFDPVSVVKLHLRITIECRCDLTLSSASNLGEQGDHTT
jgi:hypothetical protein